MKRVLISFGVLVLFNCDSFCGYCTDEDLLGPWIVNAAINNNSNEVIDYSDIILEQKITFETSGYLENNCNIRGKYSLENSTIRFFDFVVTEMFCHSIEFMDLEQKLVLNLNGYCEYEINETDLAIRTEHDFSFKFQRSN